MESCWGGCDAIFFLLAVLGIRSESRERRWSRIEVN